MSCSPLPPFDKSNIRVSILLLTILTFVIVDNTFAFAQEVQTERQRAFELFEKSNFAESIPILE